MKSKRMMLVCIVAILALALMGFGFAKWADTVTIDGNVATGNVEVSIDGIGTTDEGTALDPNYPPGDNREDKDVASCEIANVSSEGANKAVTVTIENAYPWYKPGFTFRINGEGTVPVKVESVTGPNWTDELGKFIKVADWRINVHNPVSNGLAEVNDTVTSNETNATWDGLADALQYIQLHQGGYIEVSVNMYVIEEIGDEVAPEDASTEGTITIDVAQWNEVDLPN